MTGRDDTPWGGSEELWARTARLALERGHEVAIVKYRWPEVPPKIRELQERGAWLLQLVRPQSWQRGRSLRWRLRWKLDRSRVCAALASWKPDVVCYSQGGTLDIKSYSSFL
jgi:hypothetical protein